MCKSLRRNSSLRFNTTSFSLMHSREKLGSITIFCLGRKKEEDEVEKAYVFMNFENYRKALYIITLSRSKIPRKLNRE